MNPKIVSYLALLCAVLALALHFQFRARFDRQVARTVDERERKFCAQLAIKLNESRALMDLNPVTPTNFAEVLNSYFESMATVMNAGISGPSAPERDKKK
jgi:hypothetical protein